MSGLRGKLAIVTAGIPPEHFEALKAISAARRVPYAVYVREAIEDWLAQADAANSGALEAQAQEKP